MTLAAVTALTLTASSPTSSPDPDIHGEGGGRLSASSGSGGFVTDAPVHHAYWSSFGDSVLCDTARDDGGEPEDPIIITGVRYALAQRPLDVRAYVRTVTPAQVASHPHARRGAYSQFTGLTGKPPGFDQPYASWKAPGRYTRQVAGTVVDRGCDEATEDAYADYRDKTPKQSWTSLVVAVKTGEHGSRVVHTFIDYSIGDAPHTLRIDWTVGGQGFRHHR